MDNFFDNRCFDAVNHGGFKSEFRFVIATGGVDEHFERRGGGAGKIGRSQGIKR